MYPDLEREFRLHMPQDLQTSTTPLASKAVMIVGNVLQFIEHESGDIQLPFKESSFGNVVNAAVDDHVGVQDLDSSPTLGPHSLGPRQDFLHRLQRVNAKRRESKC